MGWVGEVHNLEKPGAWPNAAAVYTTESDFCRLFKDDMRGLYALSLLLTADSELAERCFVAGLDDCIKGNPVFKGWAYAWSRRAIITNAIRTIFSPQGMNFEASNPRNNGEETFFKSGPFAAVVQLDSLERFVFVMSLLEGYSEHECAVLMNRSRSEIASARTRALQHLSENGFYIASADRPRESAKAAG